MATTYLSEFPLYFPFWFPPERTTAPVRVLERARVTAPARETPIP
jgi:hypothetical protein